jgi:hypothetical protein
VIVEKRLAHGHVCYALRFHAYGQRQYLSLPWEALAMTPRLGLRTCSRKLGSVAADRGADDAAAVGADVPRALVALVPREQAGVERELAGGLQVGREDHLLPYMEKHSLDAIGIADVDAFRQAKWMKAGSRPPRSTNASRAWAPSWRSLWNGRPAASIRRARIAWGGDR